MILDSDGVKLHPYRIWTADKHGRCELPILFPSSLKGRPQMSRLSSWQRKMAWYASKINSQSFYRLLELRLCLEPTLGIKEQWAMGNFRGGPI